MHTRCTQLRTSPRTFQLAANLLDMFHAKQPALPAEDLLAIGVAALSVSIKTVEIEDRYSALIQLLPEDWISATVLTRLEHGLLTLTNWALDSPTATDILHFLSPHLSPLPASHRLHFDAFIISAYKCGVIRFGPLVLTLIALHHFGSRPDPAILTALDVMGIKQNQADSLFAEVQSTLQTTWKSEEMQ